MFLISCSSCVALLIVMCLCVTILSAFHPPYWDSFSSFTAVILPDTLAKYVFPISISVFFIVLSLFGNVYCDCPYEGNNKDRCTDYVIGVFHFCYSFCCCLVSHYITIITSY